MAALGTLGCSSGCCGPGWPLGDSPCTGAGAGPLKMCLGVCSSHWGGDVPAGLVPRRQSALELNLLLIFTLVLHLIYFS